MYVFQTGDVTTPPHLGRLRSKERVNINAALTGLWVHDHTQKTDTHMATSSPGGRGSIASPDPSRT